MVGGAMFPQCLPRRSADSLSPSRISMKSYLGGDSKKEHRWEKTSLKTWEEPLSSFDSPRSFQVLQTDPQRTPYLLWHTGKHSHRKLLCSSYSEWVHGWEALSLVHKQAIASFHQDLKASIVLFCFAPLGGSSILFVSIVTSLNLCLSLTLSLQVTEMLWASMSSNGTGWEK